MFEWKSKTKEQIVKLLTENHARFERRREQYNDLWKLIVKVFRPRRYDILGDHEKGEQFGAEVYDQGPANALGKFVGGKIGYMVSRSIPWIQFIPMDRRLGELDHIKRYCQEAAEQVLYALNRSNFYTSLVSHLLDADSVGTSVVVPMRDEVKDRMVFDVVHPRDSYIGVDKFGDPITYHRSLKLTRLTAVDMFGDDVLPSTWFRTDMEGKELKDFLTEDEYIWAVYPNGDRDSSRRAEDLPYMSFCVLRSREGGGAAKQLIYMSQSGQPYFPVCLRSGRESGSEYGTSVCADCLTASLVVNKLGEKAVDAAHKIVEPPKIASKTLRGSLFSDAGSTTWVDDIQREGVKTWLDRIQWPITDAQMERLHQQIEDRMFIRFFEMLSAGDIKARTAYEVSQMMGEKAAGMSTIVDTLELESLEPHIKIIFDDETKAGRMPEPPTELFISGGLVDIRYIGLLSQLQRSLFRTRGIVDGLAVIERMAVIDQRVPWKFNMLEMAEEATVAQGLPQKFVRSDAEFAELMQQQMQQEQAMQQAEMAEKMSKVVPAMSKAPEAGSPAEKMMRMAGAGVGAGV